MKKSESVESNCDFPFLRMDALSFMLFYITCVWCGEEKGFIGGRWFFV